MTKKILRRELRVLTIISSITQIIAAEQIACRLTKREQLSKLSVNQHD